MGKERDKETAVCLSFQDSGYRGLYDRGIQEIRQKKGLRKEQNPLSHMGSTELAANLFRATQTDEKLRWEHIQGKNAANQTHFEVGKKIRQTIQELGGTMPENLPVPDRSIGEIEREQKKREISKKESEE
jgi:DNA-damage-inducible protein D